MGQICNSNYDLSDNQKIFKGKITDLILNNKNKNKKTNSPVSDSKSSKSSPSSSEISIKISCFNKVVSQDFNDIYEIAEKVGKGSFGIVYLVINKILSYKRAMKRIKGESNSGKDIYQEALNEISILSNLYHPNIVRFYGYHDQNNSLFILTEYCSFGELYKDKKLPHYQATIVMYQLLLGINKIHCEGYVHRDLKPENILISKIDEDGFFHIKIIDFGIAEKCTKDQYVTAFAGSLSYMAPEVFGKKYSIECDLWSCGVIMYKLLTGKLPFEGQNEKDTMQKIESGKYDREPLKEFSSNDLDLIECLLEVNPKKRITAAKALKHSLFTNHNLDSTFYKISTDEEFYLLGNMINFYENMKKKNYSQLYIITAIHIIYNLPTEHIEYNLAYKLFHKLDKSYKNYLDLDSFKAYISETTRIFKEEAKEIIEVTPDLFEAFDITKSEKITLIDFILISLDHNKLLDSKSIKSAFNYFSNGEKYLSEKRLYELFSSSNNSKNQSKFLKGLLNCKLESYDKIDLKAYEKLIFSSMK